MGVIWTPFGLKVGQIARGIKYIDRVYSTKTKGPTSMTWKEAQERNKVETESQL